jgi:hypothetical protein
MTTPNGPGFGDSAAGDPLPEATTLVRGAAEAGQQLKILGGLGVRVLCPDFPPRLRAGQDIDLACMGKSRRMSPITWRARAVSRTAGSTT